jgi:hypothetical protein
VLWDSHIFCFRAEKNLNPNIASQSYQCSARLLHQRHLSPQVWFAAIHVCFGRVFVGCPQKGVRNPLLQLWKRYLAQFILPLRAVSIICSCLDWSYIGPKFEDEILGGSGVGQWLFIRNICLCVDSCILG